MKLKIFILLFGFAISGYSLAQDSFTSGDTIFNTIDDSGLKQGFWKKLYPNGNIRYTGQFINNKPIGEFRRYYEEEGLQSVMNYSKDGKSSTVKFYYKNGELAATGKYIGVKKDSAWKYYSYYGGFLSNEEFFKNGKRSGPSNEYYESGNISQEIFWKDGIKDGAWKMWFSDETLRSEALYIKGKLHGKFTSYYPDGTIEIYGVYEENLRVGSWEYTDKNTKKGKTIVYINGLPENQAEIDKQFEEALKKYEQSKGKIKEPGLNELNIR